MNGETFALSTSLFFLLFGVQWTLCVEDYRFLKASLRETRLPLRVSVFPSRASTPLSGNYARLILTIFTTFFFFFSLDVFRTARGEGLGSSSSVLSFRCGAVRARNLPPFKISPSPSAPCNPYLAKGSLLRLA